MTRTFRNVPARRRRHQPHAATAATRLARLARRAAYREARLEAAPAPLWVVDGDWGDGFGVWPLRPGRRVGAGESLLSDPGDASHMNGAIIYWEV